MDEKKDLIEKIIEIRSSFRESKGGNKRRYRSADIIGIVIIALIFFGIVISPYWNKTDNNEKLSPSTTKKKIETKSSNSDNKSSKIVNTGNISNISKIEKTDISLVSNGFEITVKNISPTRLYTNVWISIKNLDNKEKSFKIGDDSMIIDDVGERYENIGATGIEISQTNLSASATREGSVFFKRIKEGRDIIILILDINGEKVEFTFNGSTV